MISSPDRSTDLSLRIVRGAIDNDPVRMHGAIVAALELYTIADAGTFVFDTVMDALLDRPASRYAAESAIRRHTKAYRYHGLRGAPRDEPARVRPAR